MAKKGAFLRWFIPAALAVCILLAVAAVWDLQLNKAVYSPGNLFAIFMEGFGWYPIFLSVLLLALLLALRGPAKGKAGRLVPVAGGVVLVGGLAGIFYSSYNTLVHRKLVAGFGDLRTWVWLGCVALLAVLACFLVARISAAVRGKLLFVALFGTAFLASEQLLINLLKAIWQRTRFDDMVAAGSFADFTPWYLPLGNGGSSFPSGHTANAAGVLVLLVLCALFPTFLRRRPLMLALCWGYIGVMAAARVLIGRHFLSDTVAAAAIMGLVYLALSRNALYRRGLELARQGSGIFGPAWGKSGQGMPDGGANNAF